MQPGSTFRRLRRRLRYWLDRHERNQLLREEMEFHVESMMRDLIDRGMDENEARAAAHRKFGNMTRTAEEARATWIARWLTDLAQDLRYAFRGMRREAAVTAFMVLIAGLGSGATSTVFSVVNAVLLRPLPFDDPGRLVWSSNDGQNGAEWSAQVGHYLALRESNKSFSDLAG